MSNIHGFDFNFDFTQLEKAAKEKNSEEVSVHLESLTIALTTINENPLSHHLKSTLLSVQGKIHHIIENDPGLIKSNPELIKLVEKINTLFQRIIGKQEINTKAEITLETRLTATKPVVPRPVNNSNMMTEELKKKWVDAHDNPYEKEAVSTLVNAIQHVSQEEFEKSFEQTLQGLKDLSTKEQNFDYVAGVEHGKSNAWMAELAKEKKIAPLPKNEIPLVLAPHLSAITQEKTKGTIIEYPTNIVLFDDGVYSGEQMSRVISGMIGDIRRQNDKLTKEQSPLPLLPMPRIIIACPYMTKKGEEVLKTLKDKLNADPKKDPVREIIILPHQTIPTVSEAIQTSVKKTSMTAEKQKEKADNILSSLKSMYWPSEGKEEKIETIGDEKNVSAEKKSMKGPRLLQSIYKKPSTTTLDPALKSETIVKNAEGPESRGIMYFDHKVPDEFSFPAAISKGLVMKSGGIVKGRLPLIPSTLPPYKKKINQ